MTDSIELREPRVYELSFLLMPTVAEDEVAGHLEAIKKIVTDNGGLPIADGEVDFIDLAYEMRISVDNVWQKFNQAYFTWMKFDITPEKVAVLNELLSDYDTIIRYLLIKSDRDADIARPRLLPSQKATREDEIAEEQEASSDDADTSGDVEEAQPVNEDELDKHIDEMVDGADDQAEEASEETSENNE